MEAELLSIIGYLFLAFCLAAFAIWVGHTSGCHSAGRRFYEAMDRDSELKREQDKMPIMFRKRGC